MCRRGAWFGATDCEGQGDGGTGFPKVRVSGGGGGVLGLDSADDSEGYEGTTGAASGTLGGGCKPSRTPA